jgi:hypothetical protein
MPANAGKRDLTRISARQLLPPAIEGRRFGDTFEQFTAFLQPIVS